jgi:transposase
MKKLELETPNDKEQRLKKEKEYNEKRAILQETKINKQKEKCRKKDIEWEEPIQKEEAGKAHRVRIYPNSKQRQTLRKWFGVRRWVYNKCLSVVENGTKATLSELRKKVINNDNFKTENTWMLEYEYDLRDEAVRDFIKNMNSNKAKEKKFKLQYKSKKNQSKQSISVLSKKWNKKNNFYSSIFKPSNLVTSEPLPEMLKYSSRLVHTASNKYYLCIPKSMELQSDNQAHKNMIFIDPGQVDFVTGYDPSGRIIVCGEKDSGRIARLIHYRKRLQSKIAKESNNQRKKRLRIALFRLSDNIDNLVKELHKKLAIWLCMNYSRIYIPRLNFHKCKNLNKKCKSVLASLKHCEFVNRLIHKSKEIPNCKIIEVNEAYTTKTCCSCGNLGEVKGDRSYECSNCGVSIGRDINASRNIMLRYFTNIFKLKIV